MTKLLPNKQAHSGIYVNIVLVCKGYTGMRVKLVKWDFLFSMAAKGSGRWWGLQPGRQLQKRGVQ